MNLFYIINLSFSKFFEKIQRKIFREEKTVSEGKIFLLKEKKERRQLENKWVIEKVFPHYI